MMSQDSDQQEHQIIFILNSQLTIAEKSVSILDLLKSSHIENMKLEDVFDLHFFQECVQNFNKLNSDSEYALLNLLELILERAGIQIQFGILTLAHNSGLYDKIKQILLFRVAVEDQEHLHSNDGYSQITEQLLRCYLWTVRFEPFDDLDSKIAITKILEKNISVLIRNLKQISMKQSESNEIENKQQNNEDLDKQIQSVTKTLEAFRFTIQCINNSQFFVHERVHESFAPLIHLNCINIPKCNQKIELNASQVIDNLRGSTYAVLKQLAMFHYAVREYLVKEHNIMQHMTSLIIPISNININNAINIQNEIVKQQQNEYQISKAHSQQHPSIVAAVNAINLLQSFFIRSSSNQINDSMIQSQLNLIPLIVNLIRFKQNQNHQQSEQQQQQQNKESQNELNPNTEQQRKEIEIEAQTQIRIQSLQCTHMIQQHSSIDTITLLINQLHYIQQLSTTISMSCGQFEENIQVQFWCLMNIKDLFSILRKGDEQRSFGQQRELLVYISEQCEQEGSNEDIDGNVFGYDGMKPTSYGARIEMYNRYLNKENRYLEFDDDEEEDDDQFE